MYRCVLAAAFCLGAAPVVYAQTVLTFEETLARARVSPGAVVVARARIAEAQAAVVDASVRFRENPVIEGVAGPRSGPGSRTTDVDLGITQQFETGGQRRARIAGAEAGVERQRAEAVSAVRIALYQAAVAFMTGVGANQRLRIAEETDTVIRQLLTATERRFAVGDIAAIDLNLARIEAARSQASLRAARADLAEAVGTLRALLRIPANEPIELRGSLDLPPPQPLAQLRSMVDQRSDLTAIRAEAREAEAQMKLGRALTRPDLGFRAGYEREEGDNIILGGLTVTLPAFQKGQGTLSAGTARASRTRLELETTRDAAQAELDAAYAVYEQQAELASAFERDMSASVADNEGLARRSYDAGELNLLDFLLVRRNALDARTAAIDYKIEAARSRLNVDYIAGVLR